MKRENESALEWVINRHTACAMWSDPAAKEERMVVFEMGEQWSPKVAPPRIVATAA